jgi:hypothetical protein
LVVDTPFVYQIVVLTIVRIGGSGSGGSGGSGGGGGVYRICKEILERWRVSEHFRDA